MVGVLSTREAIEMAEEASLDLIEISPNAVPPVAKISDSTTVLVTSVNPTVTSGRRGRSGGRS